MSKKTDGNPEFHHPIPRGEIAELTKAMTNGQGNRAERRRKQAELKKLMKRKG